MSSRPNMEAYPLSALQQGMLFHTLSAPGSDVYVEQLSCRLCGELRHDAFAAAWETVLARHAVLRTAFAWRGLPEPLQVVGPRVRLPLEILDWRELPDAVQAARLRELCLAERRAGFELARAPLLRLKLIVLGADAHQLVWTWHHAILDAWSVPILFEELLTDYAARCAGGTAELAPTRPFKDFIAWERARDRGAAEAFWRGELAGFAEPTPLGVDTEPAAGGAAADGGEYGLEYLPLPAADVAALRAAAQRSRLTLNTLAQGAWALLLSRYAGSDDVLFGTAVAGRPPELPGVETMVGLLINTLPVRVATPPEARLGPWLQELQRRQAEVRRYEQTPLAEVQGWSEVARGGRLFESLLVFENFPLDRQRLRRGGLEIEDVDFVERADFPLTVMMAVREESKVGVGFVRPRFGRAAARRLLHHLRTLLLELAGDDTRRLGEVSPLTAAERQQLLGEWSTGPDPLGYDAAEPATIHARFAARAAATPGAEAVRFAAPHGDVSLTYAELAAAAGRCARRLRELGVGVETRVVLCLEASPARLAAVLGVLKAGGVYVPLEPSAPPARLVELIADCGAGLVLTEPALVAPLAASSAAPVLAFPAGWGDGDDAGEPFDGGARPDNLAYLIYTSGSTGRPKGVGVSHRQLGHLVAAQLRAFAIDASSRVLQFSSLGFDASASEIFTALLAGATVCAAPRQLLVPSHDLLRLLARWEVTTATFPPSVLARLPAAELPALRTLVAAGEACPMELVARWAPGRRFLDAYGPTEVAVCATVGEVAAPRAGAAARPTIGRAIGDARVYVLDPRLRPAPLGVAGELCVGGPGVARGYWRRPARTAASFLPDPFAGAPGSRTYATGDRVRFLADGALDYLGRRDDQVKVHGFRIEPGEVEAALRADPALAEAAVVVADGPDGDRRLVACVVPAAAGRRYEWWPSIAEFLVYDELAYHAMTSDERRNASYRTAIAAHVRDRVVLEVGTGPEALLARFCVEAGARRVYAVELLTETFQKARARVRALGLEDRIEVIHGDATRVDLPARAEVCVSEIVGAIGGSEGAAVIMNGVRRLLQDGAAQIPARSTTLYAPVELPAELLDELAFDALPARYVDKVFAELGYPFDLRLCVRGLDRSCLLAPPRPFEDLDFTAPVDPEPRYAATHRIARAGRLDGFLVWLTLDTGGGALLDILEHEHCWLPVFLPLGETRLAVAAGDRIEAEAGAVLCEDRLHPDYFVAGTLYREGREPEPFRHDAPHHARAFGATPFYRRFFAGGEVPRRAASAAPPDFDAAALRERLRRRLPEHMVPAAFVRLERLPLNTSGKVDRRALAARGAAGAEVAAGGELTPPRSAAERAVAKIWQELLRLPEVGLQTNFFDHGGHSLLLLQVQDRLRAELGADVPVTELFQHPTVEALAHRLSSRQDRRQEEQAAAEASRERAAARQGGRAAIAAARARAREGDHR